MAAPRLLILADPKMLPALSNGLREGGRFDVLPVPLADGGAAAAAAPRADAVAVFYGAPGRPLAATVQMLAPAVRGKGGRIIAVLQKEAVAQRDECFRAGASDLLFMPMPKDKFVGRLEGAVALAYSPENGPAADVQVSSRTAQVTLSRAVVTAAGLHASTPVPFLPGETVRLSFVFDGAPIQAWGLVAANAPEARIRFAGLAPDEEVRFRDWVNKQPRPSQAAGAAPVPAAKPPGAPLSGPPPGFADRPRGRGEPPGAPGAAPRPKPSAAPPIVSRAVPDSELDTPPMVAPLPLPDLDTPTDSPRVAEMPDGEPKAPPAASGVDSSLFEGIQTPASTPPVEPAVEPVVWPVPLALEAAKSAVLAALFSPDQQPDVSPEVLLSAKKVATTLSGGEKAAIERLGAESHFADAAAERVVLDVARAEGARLVAASEPSKVDDAAVKAMVQRVDAVVGSLQKDADGAIARGEVEALQVVRASSAALSRDVLSLKAVADRLRGLAAAPRLGAGALDPDVVLPGQAPSARPPPPKAAEAPVRAELKEFEKFAEAKPGASRRTTLYVLFAALAAGAAYVVFFALPNVKEIDGRVANIPGVVRIETGGTGARVIVSEAFVDKPEPGLSQLIALLREKGISSAAVFNVNGVPVGQIDVKTGATTGLTGVKKPNAAPR